ncbi:DUF6069 family protein [Nocardiopsis aegyptia]|uniref:Uncharacterized protein YhhL (DUF1145 family) n=1 Tax=Nocardiopsis aegyptia TaxID=220378 RepID=A0A7Z0JBC2_9ACTN|nr:DUF6069 family protein [Nocardiopsis aegyptia]NYJ36183.1 uncharacterized protein YhhL (DUF1145 family) [Nocardiopsis aegyptia]
MSEFGSERSVNAVRLWSGGLATAVVAALVILVGTLVIRGVMDIPVLAPEEAGYLGDAGTVVYALMAAVAALLATGLLHLLLVAAPRARAFFGWIIGLVTAVAAVTPFTQGAELPSQIATAVINLVAGIAIATLLSSVAKTAVVRSPRRGEPRERPALHHEGILPDVKQAEYRGEPRGL